jgi:hypothetical protein
MILVEKQLKQIRYRNLKVDPVKPLLDADELFDIKYRNALGSSTGVERLAISLIPKSILKSVSLTLDPFSKFDAGKVKITPTNRLRKGFSSNLPRKGFGGSTRNTNRTGWTTGLVCGPLTTSSTTTNFTPGVLTSAFGKYSECRDTISSTRSAQSGFGELECFHFAQHSPSMHMYQSGSHSTLLYFSFCPIPQESGTGFESERYNEGPYGRIPSADIFILRDSERTSLLSLMQSNALKMLPGTIPDSRRYSLFRNIAELKDLPRSITSMQQTLLDLRGRFASSGVGSKVFNLRSSVENIPKEYVSYHFGWKQLYNDVIDLLNFPEKVSKEINFLLSRSGRPTTYRSQRTFPGISTGAPAFVDYPTSSLKLAPTYETVVTRSHEMRLVVNAIFDFPTTGVPQFREDLFLKKLGLNPSVTDLYNLVPWSWLIDWFTGLGNYIEAVDAINSDRALYNWGFVTGITRGTIKTVEKFTVTSSHTKQILPAASTGYSQKAVYNHTSLAEFSFQIRKDLSSMGSVRLTSNISSLSLYQSSILGAILLNRTFQNGKHVDH